MEQKKLLIESFINLPKHPEIKKEDFYTLCCHWFRTVEISFEKNLVFDNFYSYKYDRQVTNKNISKSLVLFFRLSLLNLTTFKEKKNTTFELFYDWWIKSKNNITKNFINMLIPDNEPNEIKEYISVGVAFVNGLVTDNIKFAHQYFSTKDPIKILKNRLYTKEIIYSLALDPFFRYLGIYLFQTDPKFANYLKEMNVSSFTDLNAIDIKNLYYFFEKYYLKNKSLRDSAVIISAHSFAFYDKVYIVPESRTINFKTRSLKEAIAPMGSTILSSTQNDFVSPISYRYARKYGPGSIIPAIGYDPYRIYPNDVKWNFGGFLQLPDCFKSKLEQMYLNNLFPGQTMVEIGENAKAKNKEKLKDLLFFDKSEQYIGSKKHIMDICKPGQKSLDIYIDGCRTQIGTSFNLYKDTLELINEIIQKLNSSIICHQVDIALDQISFQKKQKSQNQEPKKKRRQSFSINVQAKTKKCYNLLKLIELVKNKPKLSKECKILQKNWEFETQFLYKTLKTILQKI
jgi:hypothetical protein